MGGEILLQQACMWPQHVACGQMPLVGGMANPHNGQTQTGGHAGSTQATPGQKGDSEISRRIAGW